jgi:nucleotide-binding universal stress UspA family protein
MPPPDIQTASTVRTGPSYVRDDMTAERPRVLRARVRFYIDVAPAKRDSRPSDPDAKRSDKSDSSGGSRSRKEPSFDELAKRIAQQGPRRGSVVQPPSAWQPDEVTLSFALRLMEDGNHTELPAPIVLATILIAVESERRTLLRVLTGGGNEEIEAISNVFWPLIVLPGPVSPQVAIFDGTGVWTRTFRYTLLPPMDQVHALLDRPGGMAEFVNQARSILPFFGHDPGAEHLTVEGFLPVDPPLLFDVLSHSDFRSDPQVPHAGFLPARHDAPWYRDVVSQMQRWLDRFEQDLATLTAVRERITERVARVNAEQDAELQRLEQDVQRQRVETLQTIETEMQAIHSRHQQTMRQHLEGIRVARSQGVHAQASAATADTLVQRARHRQAESDHHVARGREAERVARQAERDADDLRREIERVHAQERADLERSISRSAQLEQDHAQRLSERELARDEFSAAAADIIKAIDGQLAARSMQKNLLAGYFLPLPSLAEVRVIWFPLWTATLRGSRGVRQLVFPPMQVRTGTGLVDTLKSLFGGVVLPLEPKTAQFDKVLRTTMEESLQKDPWLSVATQELTRAADVLADPDLLPRLDEGLNELRTAGWISAKSAADFRRAYSTRADRRSTGAPVAPDLPPGAAAEPYRPPS